MDETVASHIRCEGKTSTATRRYRIATMDCAAEESVIRRAVEPVAGVRTLRFQLGTRTLVIDAEAGALDLALAAIRRAGFDPRPIPDDGAQGDHIPPLTPADGESRWHKSGLLRGTSRLALALGLAVVAEVIDWLADARAGWAVFGLAVAAVAIWLAGFDVVRKGFGALRRGRLDINGLMSVAVIGAFLIGKWPEAAMVMALYGLAELIEARAVDRARDAIAGLMALTPDTAQVRTTEGGWEALPVAQVPVGALIQVRPGERLPLDGIIVQGSTTIDQAPVTGESMPVDKAVGDPVFAGTINQTGSIECEVSAAASQSTLAHIIEAIERAQGSRAPAQRFVDRFAAVYTPTVFLLALAVALLGSWLFGWTALDAVYKALVLLVIACPCALVISTPVTLISALTAAARRGVLIKGGAYLEEARRLKAIALDKTGTITAGKPRLVTWQVLDEGFEPARAERIASALAQHSDHPVARAIAAGLADGDASIAAFKALSGRGIEALVDGKRYVLGNHRLIEDRAQCSAIIEEQLHQHEEAGRTVSLLASDTGVIAMFAVADTVKATTPQAISDLRALGIEVVMLTGDNRTTALAVAQQAGVREVRADLLPEEKLRAVVQLKERHGSIAMTGDGINDAPALAQADVGIAMGAAGTDIAMETADVVIMNDDLRRVAELIRLSRRTYRVLWQNISLALGIKAIFLGLALFGNASMWMAVFADMGASLIVIFNGLSILRTATPP